MRTGLTAAHSDLPWVDILHGDRHPRIDQLRGLLEVEVSPLSRHFLMNHLESDAYATRDDGRRLALYDTTTERHHGEMDSIRPALILELGAIPLLETYRQASIRHAKAGDKAKALLWARRGLEVYGDDAYRLEWVEDLQDRVARLAGRSARLNRRAPVGRRPESQPTRVKVQQGPAYAPRVPPKEAPRWSVGMRVLHDAHGMGRVTRVLDDRVSVDFGDNNGEPRAVRPRDLTQI